MTCSGGACSVTTTPCGPWLDTVFVPMLAAIGAPAPGVNNLGVLHAWCPYEGTGAGYNPLAANWNLSPDDCGCWNPVVNCYCSAAAGADALAGILRDSGNYPAILSALRADLPLCAWNDPAIIAEVNTWGTHGFAAYLATVSPCGSNPCAGVVCDACSSCAAGHCVSRCAAGQFCSHGQCVSSLPPGSGPGGQPTTRPSAVVEVVGFALLATAVGAASWYAYWQRPQLGAEVGRRLNPSGSVAVGPARVGGGYAPSAAPTAFRGRAARPRKAVGVGGFGPG